MFEQIGTSARVSLTCDRCRKIVNPDTYPDFVTEKQQGSILKWMQVSGWVREMHSSGRYKLYCTNCSEC